MSRILHEDDFDDPSFDRSEQRLLRRAQSWGGNRD
jgi:hypothetical protein